MYRSTQYESEKYQLMSGCELVLEMLAGAASSSVLPET